ncbi:MAG: polysaccharide deacetylase family protein [Clostridia bacterium]|nr:polysaccharide deacetylase family protein [Clostridia bacterium]
MTKILRAASLVLVIVMSLAVFAGCRESNEPGGVGRNEVTGKESGTARSGEPTGETAATAPATETASADDPVESETGSGSSGTIPPAPAGKVVRPTDLSYVDSLPRDFFVDAASDGQGTWYMGKTVYDASTGTVTTVFERDPDTLATLDKYGAIYLKNSDRKVVYLSFDCGYENGVTPRILDVLKEKNAPGIFFVTGAYIDTSADLIKRLLDEGHLVGTHTNNHRNMALVSSEDFIYEILSNEEKLKAAIPDAPDMVFYRPPMGAASEWALAMAKAMGLTTVMWSWTQYDYDPDDQPDVGVALEKAKEGLRPGCVYLLHAVSTTNAAILGDLIDFIRGQGYEIRRLDQ